MITRQQIVEDLELLVLRIANELPWVDPAVERGDVTVSDPNHPAIRLRESAWAYAKGLASHRILELREHLLISLKEHP